MSLPFIITRKKIIFVVETRKRYIFANMKELNGHKIDFLVALIAEFGKRFGLSSMEAYRYISRYGGVQMFFNHYDILHTLSFRDMVDGMAAYCQRHGGQLA